MMIRASLTTLFGALLHKLVVFTPISFAFLVRLERVHPGPVFGKFLFAHQLRTVTAPFCVNGLSEGEEHQTGEKQE